MNCATCPACGHDLSRLERLRLGDLDVIGNASVFWRSQRVKLTPAETLLVAALARVGGAIIKRHVLAEIIDSEAASPESLLTSMVWHIRRKFRRIDAGFDEIQAVSNSHGGGLRWRAADNLIADLGIATRRERDLHKVLLLHPGYSQAQLMAILKMVNRAHFSTLVRRLQQKGLARKVSWKRGWRAVGLLSDHEQFDATPDHTQRQERIKLAA